MLSGLTISILPVSGSYTTTDAELRVLSTIFPSAVICTVPFTTYTWCSVPSACLALSVARCIIPSPPCSVVLTRLSTCCVTSCTWSSMSSCARCIIPSYATLALRYSLASACPLEPSSKVSMVLTGSSSSWSANCSPYIPATPSRACS